MYKFSILTFGCRCNQADSAAIREALSRQSVTETDDYREADLIVVNTCTVTHRADQQARQAIRRLHRENPAARLVVTGCYAERDAEGLAALPGVSFVLGNADRERLPEIVMSDRVHTHGRIFHSSLDSSVGYLLPPMSLTGGKTRPLVKIQDGCDAKCSYCIVPQVRGPGRSARPEDILYEIRSLAAQGFQEIVLTGIHLGAYGLKIKGHDRLIDLLRRIVEIPGLGRIRLSSIEPMHFDPAIIELVAENPVFARHFHIPLQSGSDRILRHMRRPYTTARFRDLLHRIQETLPDAGIGTDIIVGFPGESEGDFLQTCSLIQDLPIAFLHIFPFSPRKGTEAYSLPGRIPSLVLKQRLKVLMDIARAKSLAFRRRFVGKILPAITLAKEEKMGSCVALTGNYIHARLPHFAAPPNRLVNVRIREVRQDATYASIS